MSTVTLVEFLLARLNEDQQIAKAATPGQWEIWDGSRERWDGDPAGKWGYAEVFVGTTEQAVTYHPDTGHPSGSVSTEDATHITRHDPARVLAEVEAKRAIVDVYALNERNDDGEDYEYASGWAQGLGEAVRHMATVYSDHPDYDESWRP